jgi:hypothetical protein
MPWTEKQRRLFDAAAHDPAIAREHGLTPAGAGKLADEANRMKREGREKPARKAEPPLPPGVVDLSPVFGAKT